MSKTEVKEKKGREKVSKKFFCLFSIDWGYAFSKPLLSPYEAYVCFDKQQWLDVYPQDYYSKTDNGEWTNYFGK
jgi:hypothetical protein